MTDHDATAAPGAAPMHAILCALLALGALAPGSHLEAQDGTGQFGVLGSSLCDQREAVESGLPEHGFRPTSSGSEETTVYRGKMAKQPAWLEVTWDVEGRATRFRMRFEEDVPNPDGLFMGLRSGLSANYGEPDQEAEIPDSGELTGVSWRRSPAVGPTVLKLRRDDGPLRIVLEPAEEGGPDCGRRPEDREGESR